MTEQQAKQIQEVLGKLEDIILDLANRIYMMEDEIEKMKGGKK